MIFLYVKSIILGLLLVTLIVCPRPAVWAANADGVDAAKRENAGSARPAAEKKAIESPSVLNNSVHSYSPEALSLKQKASKMLLQEDFTYEPDFLVNPFVPFIKPPEPPPPEIPPSLEDEALPPELQKPLTPLQKMNIGEIERGLTAIVWGGLGRKAIIQDSAGKGYIVGIGTPVGGNAGVITQIFDDRLVIQQQVWDRKLKRFIPKNAVVKLRKASNG